MLGYFNPILGHTVYGQTQLLD